MPSFRLKLNKRNLAIANALKEAKGDYVTIQEKGNEIDISFKEGLIITRFDLGDIGKELTDSGWNALLREIKKTLSGAKVRDFNSELIGIHPLRTEIISMRLTPLERSFIEDAAEIEERSLTDFIRTAALMMANEVLNMEKLRRLEEERKQQEQEEQERRAYVA